MNISQAGLDLLKSFESLRKSVYTDQAGLPTIGYGHLITRDELGLKAPDRETEATLKEWMKAAVVKYSDGLTQGDCENLLDKDLSPVASAISSAVKSPLSTKQFDALCCFAYNVGIHAFKSSTMLKRINRGDFQISDEFMKWDKERNPKTGILEVSPGLRKRRLKEAELWNG